MLHYGMREQSERDL
ncbi:unnamed protein product, partial [Adineta steineri]